MHIERALEGGWVEYYNVPHPDPVPAYTRRQAYTKLSRLFRKRKRNAHEEGGKNKWVSY